MEHIDLQQKALQNGYLTALSDGKLSSALVGSGWCQRNRRSADPGADTADSGADSPHPVSAPVRTPDDPLDEAEAQLAIATVQRGVATLVEADRVKANGQALKVMLKARQRAGELIEIAAAEALFFDTARAWRDSWMNWPARVGPLVAADLNLEADRVTEVLTHHVHQQLADLGEPDAEFASTAG